jgi:hypothetical protein
MAFNGFGDPNEWKHFEENHKDFINSQENLRGTMTKVFSRDIPGGNKANEIVFLLGFLCASEYREILLLCANGYGLAAQKLLRSLYEKAGTIDYIGKHPAEAQAFDDYHWVHSNKYLGRLSDLEDPLIKERVDLVKTNYERVREQFKTTDCKKCGTKRMMFSWNKNGFDLLLKKSGSKLLEFYLEAYLEPTMQSHATMPAVSGRMKLGKKSKKREITDENQRNIASDVLKLTHIITLLILETQNEHFKLGLDEELDMRAQELESIWLKNLVL